MVSRKLAIGGAAAACAACCAPLVVPLVWPALVAAGVAGAGGVGGGWLAGLSLDIILYGSVALAAVAGGTVWLRKKKQHTSAQATVNAESASCDIEACGPADRARSLDPPRPSDSR